jgi:hypothetical protein
MINTSLALMSRSFFNRTTRPGETLRGGPRFHRSPARSRGVCVLCYAGSMNMRSLLAWSLIAVSLSTVAAEAAARHHARAPKWSAWRLSFSETGRDGAPEVYAENLARQPVPGPSDWGAVKQVTAFCRDHKAGFEIKTDGGAWGYSFWGPAYGVTYQVDGATPMNASWRGSDTGDAAVFPGDALDFLQALPDDGLIAFRVSDSFGREHDAAFRLRGIAAVRSLIARACWRKI